MKSRCPSKPLVYQKPPGHYFTVQWPLNALQNLCCASRTRTLLTFDTPSAVTWSKSEGHIADSKGSQSSPTDVILKMNMHDPSTQIAKNDNAISFSLLFIFCRPVEMRSSLKFPFVPETRTTTPTDDHRRQRHPRTTKGRLPMSRNTIFPTPFLPRIPFLPKSACNMPASPRQEKGP